MQNAIAGIGTKLYRSGNLIAGVTELGGPEIEADTIDVTTLDSPNGYREFIQGLKDGGEVSVSGFLYVGDTNGQMGLLDDLNSGIVQGFSLVFSAALGASWDFSAVVTGFSTSAAVEDAIPFECTLKVTGKPTLNKSLSSGLTNMVLSGVTLSPAYAAGVYEYLSTVANATASTTVTPTGAGQTITVNGQTVASGSASAAIALTAGAINTIVVTAQETGKVPRTYTIKIYRS